MSGSIRGLSTGVARRTLVSQWANSIRLQILVRELLALIETMLLAPLRAMEPRRTIEGAPGVWLDWIGERLGRARPLAPTGHELGFAPEDTGFSQGSFASSDVPSAALLPAGDDLYRAALRARAIGLLGNADGRSLNDEVGELASQPITVAWGTPAMVMVIRGAVDPGLEKHIPVPTGVALATDVPLTAALGGGEADMVVSMDVVFGFALEDGSFRNAFSS